MRHLKRILLAIPFAACICGQATAQPPGAAKNVVVYREAGRYAGWPANNGIWAWGDEIVVGFHLGFHKDKEKGHPIDHDAPQAPRLARSRDGGETWAGEIPSFLDSAGTEKTPQPCPGGIDFAQPNFAMMLRMEDSNQGFSRFYWSADRCHTWSGPFQLPTFDRPGVMARTDLQISGKHELTALLTSAKDGGGEGWPFAARTTDGARTWKFLSWIGEQPGPGGYAIMPSTVRLSPTELFTFIRCRTMVDGKKTFRIEPYRSLDNGASWQFEAANIIDNGGNPPHMIQLKDGRVALTFGCRNAPYGVRARLSGDGGRSWTGDIILRDDAENWDVGYPRTVQRTDGKIVTAYYFNDRHQKERYIAATIWDPGAK